MVKRCFLSLVLNWLVQIDTQALALGGTESGGGGKRRGKERLRKGKKGELRLQSITHSPVLSD